ncbi:hypothetical protein K402DRAFT_393747 [Aulographum hederae CBS 113979]|uniref:Uncharacterized protein n=1 Tax=Aulographum hederae CBS 113979 TaxID=1176131 RepID=A0A6G1H0D9_9PEZI|nr:hypothetical protein K402DRAFT_393747 [Aulographum hederae CBS 113979]
MPFLVSEGFVATPQERVSMLDIPYSVWVVCGCADKVLKVLERVLCPAEELIGTTHTLRGSSTLR